MPRLLSWKWTINSIKFRLELSPTFSMKPELIIAHFSSGSVLIPLMLVFASWKKLTVELKPLFWILLVSLLSDALALILMQYSIHTHFIGNIYLIAQFSLLILIFRKQLHNNRIVDFILALFILFFIINISFFQGPWVFNSVSNVVACLILIAFCLFYFYRLLNDLPIVHIQQLPMLWITFAVLTYYGGNFFLFLVKNYLTYGDAGTHKIMWILHNLLNITKNILFAIALWQSYRKVKSFTLSSSAH